MRSSGADPHSALRLEMETRINDIIKQAEITHEDLVRVPTTVDRAIGNLRELVEARIDSLYAKLAETDKAIILLQTRTDRTPEFVRDQVQQLKDLHAAVIEGAVTEFGEKIHSLSDVTAQQFKSISDQFAEKDKAVSVGLSAQKESAAAQQSSNMEATNKMEANFTTLLRQGQDVLAEVRRNYDQQIAGLQAAINGLASRLDRGEGRSGATDPQVQGLLEKLMVRVDALSAAERLAGGRRVGAQESRKDTRDNTAIIISCVAIFVAIGIGFLHTTGKLP